MFSGAGSCYFCMLGDWGRQDAVLKLAEVEAEVRWESRKKKINLKEMVSK